MLNEKLQILSGKWQDTYIKADGSCEKTEVFHNQIQDGAYTVVASLLANQFDIANAPAQTPTTFGISHIDFGSGAATWDDVANQPIAQPTADTQINNAVYRQPIAQNQIAFVPAGDPFGGVGVSDTPTNRLRISIVLTELEPAVTNGAVELREFGLFCRYNDNINAANQVNNGLIFNWVIHPLIAKDNTLRIERVIEITISRCP